MKILGLDNDNYTPIFVCEDGWGHYYGFKELVEFLSRPHQFKVEVRMFALADEWSDGLQKYTEEEVNKMFNALAGNISYPEVMIPEVVFDMFWESANCTWW